MSVRHPERPLRLGIRQSEPDVRHGLACAWKCLGVRVATPSDTGA